ncbi:MAG: YciI family protein [Flavisolibacter sp.]
MYKLFILLVSMFCGFFSVAQNKNYDSVLAKKLGADDYGMKQYVMVFLKQGTKFTDTARRNELLEGHLKNIGRLAKEGKLAIAGPFLDRSPYAGIFIFNSSDVEEVKTLVQSDPAVKAGMFDIEAYRWYGSAALGQVTETHEKVQKKNILE